MISSTNLKAIVIFALISLSAACSRNATCALEGCTKNGGVRLASDFESEKMPAQESDAVVDDNSALEKEIQDIRARLDLNESMTGALSETVALHEKRIKALEDKSTTVDAELKDLGDRVSDTESDLMGLDQRIASVELQLNGSQDDAGLVQELADLKQQQNETNGKLSQLRRRVGCLEEFRRDQEVWNKNFSASVGTLTTDLNALKDRVADAEENIDALQEAVKCIQHILGLINGKVSTLQSQVDNMNDSMATDTELLTAKNAVLATLRGEIDNIKGDLQININSVRTVAESKTTCQIGDKYRDGILWYRNISCDGRTLKILVL